MSEMHDKEIISKINKLTDKLKKASHTISLVNSLDELIKLLRNKEKPWTN